MENLVLGTQFKNMQTGDLVQLIEVDTDGESWFTFAKVKEDGSVSKSFTDIQVMHRREVKILIENDLYVKA